MHIERGTRRVVLVISVGLFVFNAWSVWQVIDHGMKERALWEARTKWEERECPKILAGPHDGAGYKECQQARELNRILDEVLNSTPKEPPPISSPQREPGDAPFPLRVWWPWLAYWETSPLFTANLGALLSAGLALIPWCIFYLGRWIVRGFGQ